jgi:hypothetical protein
MTVINSVGNALTGSTGTVNFVGSNTPTLITPVLGAASATSLSFSSTTGLIGTTTNDSAASGTVGQYISSNIVQVSFVDITAGANITSISLTAGDWDVGGNCSIIFGGAGSVYGVAGWISSTSNTLPDASLYNAFASNVATLFVSGNQYNFTLPTLRFSLSGTTTIYMSANISAIGGATAGGGGLLWARRMR